MEISNALLKKNVAAIHTNGYLSLLERKMVNVLLLHAYDNLLTQRTHSLPVSYLYAMLGWDQSCNISLLKSVLSKLTVTKLEFNLMQDDKEVWQTMAMLSYGEISGGICTYRYDESLAEKLYDPEIYAMINIGVQKNFDGGYAFTLYENCVRYKNVGSTGWWELDKFRKIMGATASAYSEFKYLKREVISRAVKEVNKVSNIWIDVEYKKINRKVCYLRFVVSDNPQQTLLQPNLSDRQEAIRETELYKRLKAHGLGDRLVISWITQDHDRAESVLRYVEEKDKKKLIKGSTAGYIRKLIEEKADVGKKTEYEIKKDQKNSETKEAEIKIKINEKLKELKAEFKEHLIKNRIKEITPEEHDILIQKYNEEAGEEKLASYSIEEREFKNSVDRIVFYSWLRLQISVEIKIDNKKFNQWMRTNRENALNEQLQDDL